MKRIAAFGVASVAALFFPLSALAHGLHPEMDDEWKHVFFHGLEEGLLIMLCFAAAFAIFLFFHMDEE